jgi:hypothetical protein
MQNASVNGYEVVEGDFVDIILLNVEKLKRVQNIILRDAEKEAKPRKALKRQRPRRCWINEMLKNGSSMLISV